MNDGCVTHGRRLRACLSPALTPPAPHDDSMTLRREVCFIGRVPRLTSHATCITATLPFSGLIVPLAGAAAPKPVLHAAGAPSFFVVPHQKT